MLGKLPGETEGDEIDRLGVGLAVEFVTGLGDATWLG